MAHYTAKERDSESGLDYFGARYYGSALGRFASPDAPFIAQHPAEPQSWNLYSYTAGNPLSRIDPDGRNWFNINGAWKWYEGSDVNNNGDPCKKGAEGCNHSDYTHLLRFEKIGINNEGAAIGTLTLYGNDHGKPILTDTAFSGGNGSLAAGNGDYRIKLHYSTLTLADII